VSHMSDLFGAGWSGPRQRACAARSSVRATTVPSSTHLLVIPAHLWSVGRLQKHSRRSWTLRDACIGLVLDLGVAALSANANGYGSSISIRA